MARMARIYRHFKKARPVLIQRLAAVNLNEEGDHALPQQQSNLQAARTECARVRVPAEARPFAIALQRLEIEAQHASSRLQEAHRVREVLRGELTSGRDCESAFDNVTAAL